MNRKDEQAQGSELSVKLDALKAMADNAYCRYLQQLRSDPCLGSEWKMAHGKFTQDNLDAFMRACEDFGRHKGIHEAIKILSA